MIRFSSVTKRFRKTCVLDDISLEIGLSERVALIGSNGAGKTTLIRCLLGEYTFDGEVIIDGRDPRKERTAVLGAIGDSAGGYSALTLLPAGSEVVSIEYKINFLKLKSLL